MPGLPGGHLPIYEGVAGRIQAVVPQQAVQVGPGGLGGGLGAGPGEQLLTGLAVEGRPQSAGGRFHQGVVVEEKVGALQTHVKQAAEALDALLLLRGKGGQHLPAEAVMGVKGGHRVHLLLFFSVYTKTGKIASSFSKSFLFGIVKPANKKSSPK